MQNAAGIPALMLLGLAAISAMIYGVFYCRKDTAAGTVFKTASVLLLAVFARISGGPALLVVALVLSSLGDFFLSRPGNRAFLAGMAAFFSAHLAYIAIFGPLSGPMLQSAADGVVLAAMLAFCVVIYRLISPRLGRFRGPVAVYILAILGMGWLAAHLDWPRANGFAGGVVMAGAGLFVISDTILALQKFRFRAGAGLDVAASYLVWPSYWLAQFLITLGMLEMAG